jgi:hypothetical protein
MKSLTTIALGAFVLAALVHAQSALGQGAPPASSKRAPLASPADVEPAVDVSEPRVALIDAPPPVAAAPAPTAAAVPAPAVSASPSAEKSSGLAQRSAPKRSAAAPSTASTTPGAPAASSTRPAIPAPNSRAMDTLDLGTTSITGNQELPKVLYIVPWKKSDLGDLVGRPVNTLLDEVLEPVDPEVFQRHLSYYDALYGKGQKGKE